VIRITNQTDENVIWAGLEFSPKQTRAIGPSDLPAAKDDSVLASHIFNGSAEVRIGDETMVGKTGYFALLSYDPLSEII
jgi:hypothetical protein